MDERSLALPGTLAETQRELGPTVYDGAVERACRYASVRGFARTINRLAHRLLDRRVLGGDEVRKIIGAPDPEDDAEGLVMTVGGPHE